MLKAIVFIVVIWILTFGILVLPARPVGRWMVRLSKGPISTLLDIVLCVVRACNVVAIGWITLVFWRPDFFPHVISDPTGFGKIFAAVLLFVPSFLAFLMGYLRARKMVEAQ
ncbi:hypothetical protein V1291_005065 [Nitrobacteraceae bacterium AZCC 1564]